MPKSLEDGKQGKDTGKPYGSRMDDDDPGGYVSLSDAEYKAAKKLGEKSAAAFAAENNGRMPPGWG